MGKEWIDFEGFEDGENRRKKNSNNSGGTIDFAICGASQRFNR